MLIWIKIKVCDFSNFKVSQFLLPTTFAVDMDKIRVNDFPNFKVSQFLFAIHFGVIFYKKKDKGL